MIRRFVASSTLTAAATFYTFADPAWGQTRCEANLARQRADFCISSSHLKGATSPLQYNWKLNDTLYALTSPVCIEDGTADDGLRDVLITIDRSQNTWAADASRRKFGLDHLEAARKIMAKLRQEAEKSDRDVKVSLVLYSTDSDCREYTGGAITFSRDFPCATVAFGPIRDDAHFKRANDLLDAAKNKFSQSGQGRSSDYSIISNLIADKALGIPTLAASPVLLMFADGRTYTGKDGDPYAYLNSQAYVHAQDTHKASYKKITANLAFVSVALDSVIEPAFGPTHKDAYETMCALAGASPVDCDKSKVNYANPATWPANKVNVRQFMKDLVGTVSNSAGAVTEIDSNASVDAVYETLKARTRRLVTPESAAISTDGTTFRDGTVTGQQVRFEPVPAEGKLDLTIKIRAAGRDFLVPLAVTTTQVPDTGTLFEEAEMRCEASSIDPAVVDPEIDLKNLQGGSASCGVSGLPGQQDQTTLFLLLIPAMLSILAMARVRHGAVLMGLLGSAFAGAESIRAETKGVNTLHHRPVVDGAGNTETAGVLQPGTYNIGLFADYANDNVELGGEKNKRIDSVMDDLVTTHFVANLGLFRRTAAGVHVPYIYKTDIERASDGEETSGGKIGEPADTNVFLKVNIVDRRQFSFALMPMGTIATGRPEYLTGEGTSTYGGALVFSGISGSFSWGANAGYMHRDEPLELADDRAAPIVIRGQYLTMLGGDYQVNRWFAAGAHFQAKFTDGEKIDLVRNSPAEWQAIGKFLPVSGIEIMAGAGTGLGKGYGSPDYRAFAGVSYIPAVQQRQGQRVLSSARK